MLLTSINTDLLRDQRSPLFQSRHEEMGDFEGSQEEEDAAGCERQAEDVASDPARIGKRIGACHWKATGEEVMMSGGKWDIVSKGKTSGPAFFYHLCMVCYCMG